MHCGRRARLSRFIFSRPNARIFGFETVEWHRALSSRIRSSMFQTSAASIALLTATSVSSLVLAVETGPQITVLVSGTARPHLSSFLSNFRRACLKFMRREGLSTRLQPVSSDCERCKFSPVSPPTHETCSASMLLTDIRLVSLAYMSEVVTVHSHQCHALRSHSKHWLSSQSSCSEFFPNVEMGLTLLMCRNSTFLLEPKRWVCGLPTSFAIMMACFEISGAMNCHRHFVFAYTDGACLRRDEGDLRRDLTAATVRNHARDA